MMESLKQRCERTFEQWTKEVKASPDGVKVIDIAKEVERLLSQNIITIAFGEDINDEKLVLQVTKEVMGTEFVSKSLTLGEAVHQCMQQVMQTFMRLGNPIFRLRHHYMGKSTNFTAYERQVTENCTTLRNHVLKYVRARKDGTRQSKVGKNADLLSLFFANPDVFTEEVIIDELLDFFIAGTQTLAFAIQCLLCHYATAPDSLAKVRAELRSMGGNVASEGRKAMLAKTMQLETLGDLSYLGQVAQEVLRYRPPAATSSIIELTKDTKVGKYDVKAGDNIVINIEGLHFNANEWRDPLKFYPQRFDTEDKAFLTPSGSKRNPSSYIPFLGGKRICFGKTFAETNLKVLASYLAQYFNYEFVDERYRADNFPILHANMSKIVPIVMKLRCNEE